MARLRSSTLSLLHNSSGPKSGRFSALVFLLVVIALFISLGLHAARPRSFRSLYSLTTSSPSFVHPISLLLDNAESKYRAKLTAQSTSLSAAVSEYTRRHNRPPPKGFDDWYRFAAQNNVVMIDEFDGIVKDLAPFWNLTGLEMRRRANQAGSIPRVDLVRIRNGELSMLHITPEGQEIPEVSGRAAGFKSMLEDFAHKLPDLEFAVNAQSENRVLLPWEIADNPNTALQDSSEGIKTMLKEPFKHTFEGDGNLWEVWRRTCEPSKNARQLFSSLRDPFALASIDYTSKERLSTSEASFVSNTDSQFDYCGSPYAHYLQGHFFTDVRPIDRLYPILSPAKAEGFADIRIPSHYYYGSTPRYTYGWDPVNLELKDVDKMEVPWDEKSDKIYYRSIALGGGTTPPGFSAQYQRHRFVRMASDASLENNRSVTVAVPPDSDNYVSASVPIGTLNDEVMDAGFALFSDADNYAGGEEVMEQELNHYSSEKLNRNWAYKYNIDLDGLGYSGKFMALLASDSVPVKATVYDEFYSDWIQPWVHFIPISQMYHEVYNIHAYFSGGTSSTLRAANSTVQDQPSDLWHPATGDARLRRIARAGKVWHQTMARKVDLQAYVYRLSLEYARLSADDRDAMNYS